MSKKMSYVNALNAVLEGQPIEGEILERLTALRDSQAKRTSRKSGPSKTQLENAAFGEAIVAAMTPGEVYTIAGAKGLVPELANATPQKVGPILRTLAKDGRLTADKVKGVPVYSLA